MVHGACRLRLVPVPGHVAVGLAPAHHVALRRRRRSCWHGRQCFCSVRGFDGDAVCSAPTEGGLAFCHRCRRRRVLGAGVTGSVAVIVIFRVGGGARGRRRASPRCLRRPPRCLTLLHRRGTVGRGGVFPRLSSVEISSIYHNAAISLVGVGLEGGNGNGNAFAVARGRVLHSSVGSGGDRCEADRPRLRGGRTHPVAALHFTPLISLLISLQAAWPRRRVLLSPNGAARCLCSMRSRGTDCTLWRWRDDMWWFSTTPPSR